MKKPAAAKKKPVGAPAVPVLKFTSRVTCTKRFSNLPFAHRQHTHDGHCALIHGHNWDFEITFDSDRLDACGFVVDFGKLKWVRAWLEDRFDHTLVLNDSDPHLEYLRKALVQEDITEDGPSTPPAHFAKIITVPNCGAEGLAGYVLHHLNREITDKGIGQDVGLYVRKVVAYEDEKNSATFEVL